MLALEREALEAGERYAELMKNNAKRLMQVCVAAACAKVDGLLAPLSATGGPLIGARFFHPAA